MRTGLLQAVIDSYAANFAQLGFGVGGRPGTAAAMTHRFLNGIEAAAAVDCHYSNTSPSIRICILALALALTLALALALALTLARSTATTAAERPCCGARASCSRTD